MEEYDFYLLDIDHKTKEENIEILLFGKINDKYACLIDDSFEDYVYIITKKDIKKLLEKLKKERLITDFKEESKFFLRQKVDAIKVNFISQKSLDEIKEKLRAFDKEIKIEEKDVPVEKKYLIDKNICPLNILKIKGERVRYEGVHTDIILKLNSLKPTKEFAEPKLLAFDIETYTKGNTYSNPEKDPIISIAFYGKNFKKIITWKKVPTDLDVIFAKNEEEFLKETEKLILNYKPDYLIGYNSDNFDLPYIKKRAEKLKVDLKFLDTGIKLTRTNRGSCRLTGIQHIDIYVFISRLMAPTLMLDSYTLNEVSKNLIGEQKDEIDFNKVHLVWDKNSKEINTILEYNLQDSKITYKVAEKIIPNINALTKLVNQPPYDVIRMMYGSMVENHLMKKTRDFNEIIPNRPSNEEVTSRIQETYEGATVIKPIPGLYENILVADFKGFYPSIIVTYNIDKTTLTKEKSNSFESPEINGKHYYFKKSPKGFIPEVLEEIVYLRNKTKEIMKKDKTNNALRGEYYALKTLANSTYGYEGFFGARWYCREGASSITAFAREHIKKVVNEAEKHGFKVLYGDTDSIFMLLGDKKLSEAEALIKKLNEKLPKLMELDLEGVSKRGIFVSKKTEDTGAKKKYALIDEKGNISVKGFETVRRDWSYLAKEIQRKVLEIVLKEGSSDKAVKYVQDIIEKIRKKQIMNEKMVIRTSLKKPIESYKNVDAHVVVAKRMKQLGMPVSVGTTIRFIVSEGSGLISNKSKIPEEVDEGNYDSEYYINNQIVPAVEMIFEALKKDKNILIKSKSQKTLGDF
ncbi:MAG: DNA-directed DNA polymerase [Candidatus Nanoarchaeia archaeon]|nr:DNA-directed DNA polymerase [Candidatus Nanoarchaeia archaeon]